MIDITASVKEPDEGWVATGPSNAVVLSSGRILVPMDTNVGHGSITIDYDLVPGSVGRNRQCPMSSLRVGVRGQKPAPLPPLHHGAGNVDPSVTPGRPASTVNPCNSLNLDSLFKLQQRALVIISDDHGKTWRRSSFLPLLASETALADLGGGRVLARSRLAEGGWQDGCHHFAKSSDGGETWEAARPTSPICIPDPGVQASLLGTSNTGGVLLASPLIEKRCGDHLRGNLTLYKSEDFGLTWAAGVPVHQDCSGYSSVVLIGKKNEQKHEWKPE